MRDTLCRAQGQECRAWSTRASSSHFPGHPRPPPAVYMPARPHTHAHAKQARERTGHGAHVLVDPAPPELAQLVEQRLDHAQRLVLLAAAPPHLLRAKALMQHASAARHGPRSSVERAAVEERGRGSREGLVQCACVRARSRVRARVCEFVCVAHCVGLAVQHRPHRALCPPMAWGGGLGCAMAGLGPALTPNPSPRPSHLHVVVDVDEHCRHVQRLQSGGGGGA